MKPVIVFGTHDVSQLAAFYLENDSDSTVFGYCVDRDYLDHTKYNLDKPVLAYEDISPEDFDIFIPLYDNKLRQKKADIAKLRGFKLVSYISSKSVVWPKVGENCFIMENNTIQPYTEIGNNIIMWSGNHIGHHTKIMDNVFISSHVVISGNCLIEQYSWFGVNSTVKDHTVIAEGTFVAMSATITKNTSKNKRYIGTPAKEF